jgi:hypothetical protein
MALAPRSAPPRRSSGTFADTRFLHVVFGFSRTERTRLNATPGTVEIMVLPRIS